MTTDTLPEEDKTLSDFIPKKSFPERYLDLITKPEFEWQFKCCKVNGFDKAFKQVGRKFFVYVPTYHDCLLNR